MSRFLLSSSLWRNSRRKCFHALALGVISVISASASTIQLGITGDVQVGQDFINFGQFPAGDPYSPAPGTGSFVVSIVNPGIFATDGVTAGQTGSIESLAIGQPVAQPFMSIQGSNSLVQMYLLNIPAGATSGPFTMMDSPNGAIVFMNFAGVVTDGANLENFTGTFSATFNGTTVADLLNEELNGVMISTPFSATFSAVTNPAPEPETFALWGLGLSCVGLIARRKKK